MLEIYIGFRSCNINSVHSPSCCERKFDITYKIRQRWERIYVYGMFRRYIVHFFSILPAAKLILSPLYSGVVTLRTAWTKYHLWPAEIINTGFLLLWLTCLYRWLYNWQIIVISTTIWFWILGNQDGVSCDFHIGKQRIMSETCKVHTPDIWNAMHFLLVLYPDSNVHRANMGPTWVLPAPDGLHVCPMNLAIRVSNTCI